MVNRCDQMLYHFLRLGEKPSFCQVACHGVNWSTSVCFWCFFKVWCLDAEKVNSEVISYMSKQLIFSGSSDVLSHFLWQAFAAKIGAKAKMVFRKLGRWCCHFAAIADFYCFRCRKQCREGLRGWEVHKESMYSWPFWWKKTRHPRGNSEWPHKSIHNDYLGLDNTHAHTNFAENEDLELLAQVVTECQLIPSQARASAAESFSVDSRGQRGSVAQRYFEDRQIQEKRHLRNLENVWVCNHVKFPSSFLCSMRKWYVLDSNIWVLQRRWTATHLKALGRSVLERPRGFCRNNLGIRSSIQLLEQSPKHWICRPTNLIIGRICNVSVQVRRDQESQLINEDSSTFSSGLSRSSA